jgi:hypothetical protein
VILQQKRSPTRGLTGSACSGEELRSAGWRHDAVAIDLTSGWIKAAKVGMKSTSNLLEFLFTQKAGTGPAQHSVFLQVWH